MPSNTASDQRWLWYSCRTPRCIPLDREAYPLTMYDGLPVPWPAWACKAPDGGIHYSASSGPIDIDVAERPSGPEEFQWTCEFQVFVLLRSWFLLIEDLVDGRFAAAGRLFHDRKPLSEWVTLHGVRPPILHASEGWSKRCPVCGNPYSLLRGRKYFTDPFVREMPIVVNGSGIFVREDEAIRRNLRKPTGAFKPLLVGLETA